MRGSPGGPEDESYSLAELCLGRGSQTSLTGLQSWPPAGSWSRRRTGGWWGGTRRSASGGDDRCGGVRVTVTVELGWSRLITLTPPVTETSLLAVSVTI